MACGCKRTEIYSRVYCEFLKRWFDNRLYLGKPSAMSSTASVRVAFIGLGIMGKPMAGHLLSAGYPVVVHSRTQSKADHLIDRGATWADTPRIAATSADVVFVCVTDTPDVKAVLLGPGGVIESARPGLIVVDHSTISPTATREFAAELSQRDTTLLDAPVSGGDLGAKNATLSIMVGGGEAAFQKVLPLLQVMGKTITHCGPSGAGQLTKLVNQVLVSLTSLAVCEAMNLAIAGGLDPAKTITAVAGGAAGSWQLSHLGPKMVAGDFAPGFMIDLQHKDLRLVLEAASQAGVDLKTTRRVTELFAEAQKRGFGREGTQALFKIVRG
jgi:3-hydroxyisobutyrate dehydrogenase